MDSLLMGHKIFRSTEILKHNINVILSKHDDYDKNQNVVYNFQLL